MARPKPYLVVSNPPRERVPFLIFWDYVVSWQLFWIKMWGV